MSTPAFVPTPCAGCGGGAGSAGLDAESNLVCDTLPDGSVVGTALAVYTFDENGNPVGPPDFVHPITQAPYVAQGILQPCPGETGCLEPVQFCFTASSTGPVQHPGREYDFSIQVSPGFDFTSLVIDGTEHQAGIFWQVTDPDGAQFADAVEQFIQNRFTSLGATVTVTNPNAGTVVCGNALPLAVHIECVRLDEPAPNVVEAVYNAGSDLVTNPAYLTTPPTDLNGPQFVYLRRQDAGGTLNCTGTANRGWETNDLGDGNRDFEVWGQGPGGLQTIQDTTPTPRGTPVQEITADINDTGPGPTIWQTFNVPVGGTFNATLVHGARDAGEQHTIRLSTGDTNDTGPGDIINNITNPAQVTNAGGNSPGPWTQFQQAVNLAAGEYTFSLTTTNPVGANRGGLFTDMRVYVDAPNTRATAINADTCTVETTETSNTTTCELWSPLCESGDITAWKNAETGEVLSNAGFWGQTPSPECCTGTASTGGGGTVTAGNLVHAYLICGVVGGVPQTLTRVVYTDQSGGVLASAIIGPEGGPVTPSTWSPGSCDVDRDVELVELCDVQAGGGIVPFVRRMVFEENGSVFSAQNLDANGNVYVPTGTVTTCSAVCGGCETLVLCDSLPGSPVERIANGDFVTDGAGWVFTGSAARTAFAGEPGPDNVPGVIGFNGANQPPNGTATTTINTGIVAGDLFSLTYRVGSFSSSSASQGPVQVLAEVLDGSDNVLASQTISPSLSAGTGVATWPPNGFGSLPGIVATDGIIKVRFTDQSTGNLVDADMMVDKVSLIQQQLTGETVQFLRTICRECDGTATATIDTTLAGAPYAVQGVVALCEPTTEPVPTPDTRDAEILILCDSTPTRFLRKYLYDGETGAFTTVVNTTLDGTTPFAPVGAVGICTTPVATDFDFAIEQLCDNNGAFLRRFTFNSATGAVTTITNTNLAGGAYVPVGTVGTCENCCPQVVGEGCTNVGSGRYTAIRAVNGTISLIDSVTGAAVLQANIIACVSDDTVITSTAEARLLNAGESWTPGTDLTGTLTGLMFQVLTGTADLVDANGTASSDLPAGTSVSWSTEDNNVLTGPQSITADAASSVLVTWTRH